MKSTTPAAFCTTQSCGSVRPLLIGIAWIALSGVSLADDTTPVTCKDGITSPRGGRNACAQHGGIDEAATAAAAQGTDNTPPPTTGSTPSTTSDSRADETTPAPAASPTPKTRAPQPSDKRAKVWVNTASKVYHCPSDPKYGKTRQGEYMSEADAKAKGNHADHDKPCDRGD
jgi:hypothetical protein